MTPVFLDTVGLLAVWDDDDQWHAQAVPTFIRLLASGRPVVTSTAVLLECGNGAARRTYRSDVCDLRVQLMTMGRLVEPTADEVREAWAAYERGEAGEAGIVDHLSFAIMRRLGVTEAFTNDRHFAAAGFTTLF